MCLIFYLLPGATNPSYRCEIHWFREWLFWAYGIIFGCRQATHHAIYQPYVAGFVCRCRQPGKGLGDSVLQQVEQKWLGSSCSSQMSISTLAELNGDSKYWTICLYVSRLDHRQGTDNGPIKHSHGTARFIGVFLLNYSWKVSPSLSSHNFRYSAPTIKLQVHGHAECCSRKNEKARTKIQVRKPHGEVIQIADKRDDAETKFVFFDRVGRELIGMPLISLLRYGQVPGVPLERIVENTGELFQPQEN